MEQTASGATVAIRYDGEPLRVPAGRTVLVALEAVGVRLVRGVGCRGGVCGACTIFYRVAGKSELTAALLCQEVVREGMEILPLPYFPQKKADYGLGLPAGESPAYRVLSLYPETNNCIMCGECTRLCPVDIDVMGYVGMIKRGDLRGAASASLTCVQCQACAVRCPAQISQPNAALAARRFYGRHQMPPADHLARMLERTGGTDGEARLKRGFSRLRRMDREDLQVLYQRREREPEDAPPGTWLPDDRALLV